VNARTRVNGWATQLTRIAHTPGVTRRTGEALIAIADDMTRWADQPEDPLDLSEWTTRVRKAQEEINQIIENAKQEGASGE